MHLLGFVDSDRKTDKWFVNLSGFECWYELVIITYVA